ncbi:MAG: hypothetical protein V2A74_10225 [bacterium]
MKSKNVIMSLAVCVLLVGTAAFAAAPAAITAWTVQPGLWPTGFESQMGGAALSGDYLYYCGGNNGTDGDTAKTWIFSINSVTGALSTPSAGPDLPTAANYAYNYGQTLATTTTVYIVGGGYNTLGPNRNNVTFNTGANTGVLQSTWTESATFPGGYDPELSSAVFASNGYLYSMGGDSQTGALWNTVVYAQVNPNGTLGTHTAGTSLPRAWYFTDAVTMVTTSSRMRA